MNSPIKSNRGNFANDPQRAREAGRKGGLVSPKNKDRQSGERNRRDS